MARTGGANAHKSMSIMGHIQELQTRLVLSAIVLIIAGSLAYVFRDPIIHTLLSPLGGQQLIYLNPAGGFSFILLVSIYVGLAAAAPVIIHQLYCFVRPALPKKVQRYSVRVLLCSLLLLLCGVMFGYMFAIPGALNFLYEFAGEYVEASLTAESYINFVVAYTLGLGLVFQLPLLLMLIHWIKPLTPTGLMKSQRWVIVLAFVAAAIITPTPDPLNQTIIAMPIIIVYQLGVVAVLYSIYKERRRHKKAVTQTQPAPQPEHPITEEPMPLPPPPAQPLQPETQPIILNAPSPSNPRARRSIDGFGAPRHPSARSLSSIQRRSPHPYSYDRAPNYRPGLSLDGISRPT